jgi:hypothetical protein
VELDLPHEQRLRVIGKSAMKEILGLKSDEPTGSCRKLGKVKTLQHILYK